MINTIYNITTIIGEALLIILYMCALFDPKKSKEFLKKYPMLTRIIMVLMVVEMIRFILNITIIINS